MTDVRLTIAEVHLRVVMRCRRCRTSYEPGDECCQGCGEPLLRVCAECGEEIPMHASARFLGRYWCITHYEQQLL